jgi:glycosyltransferase involved in cell wall biosynthesis
MNRPVLHQFLTGATAGDAITGQAFIIRDWLRDLGFESTVFALHVDESVTDKVMPLYSYRRTPGETWAIYHHSIGSAVPEFLSQQRLTLLLIYHNITPPDFFARVDPQWAGMSRQGLAQLQNLRNLTGMALADSEFNELDLSAAGYRDTSVLPITLRSAHFEMPSNETTEARIRLTDPNLLFVSRFAPNKRQEDLVMLMAYLCRIYPSAGLHLVGPRWEVGYDRRVEQLAAHLGLSKNVVLTGKVTDQDLLTYYRTADLYVSMSEHEGFGVPLIESMYCRLPVLAYGAAAVPYTMGTAGVIFTEKRYPELAELVDILLTDKALRRRIIARQSDYVQAFLEAKTRQMFEDVLERIDLLNPSR